jgi:hypothetical protein
LPQNKEEYKGVAIDHAQFERWPPVWVAEDISDLAGPMDDGSREDGARIGIATEDSDNTKMAPGDVPMTASRIINTRAVSQPSQLNALQQVSLCKSDRTINVLTGNNILMEDNMPSYFTSAFPTIFPWRTGKHIDVRRSQERKRKLEFKKWIQLLLRNLSRYRPRLIKLISVRCFQAHRGFIVLFFDLLRPAQPAANRPNHKPGPLGNDAASVKISH